jgi:hypothetical protein
VRASLWERARGQTRRPTTSWELSAAWDTTGKGDLVGRGNVLLSGISRGLSFPNVAGLLLSVQSGGCPPSWSWVGGWLAQSTAAATLRKIIRLQPRRDQSRQARSIQNSPLARLNPILS